MSHIQGLLDGLASVVISTRRCEVTRKVKIYALLLRCTMLYMVLRPIRRVLAADGDNAVSNFLWAFMTMGPRNVYKPSDCDSQPVRTLHTSARDTAGR
jgi:hypothetical protein